VDGKVKKSKSVTMYNFDKKTVLNAIKDSSAIMSTIAKRLNCDWITANRYCHKWEATKEALENEKEKILDFAEGKMLEIINGGDGTMIRYLLSTKGKQRGYTEKTEVELSGGVKIIRDDIK
jgi:hypothetical protein